VDAARRGEREWREGGKRAVPASEKQGAGLAADEAEGRKSGDRRRSEDRRGARGSAGR